MIIISILITILLIIISVIVFCLIITIHEFGHFITAKMAGVRVNEFAIGMGPLIKKFQKGETQYSIRLLPIGGFCTMEGEDEQSGDPKAFGNKEAWKRILIIAMGAIFNIILGFILMSVILVQQPAYPSTTVGQFQENAKTEYSGLMVGDTITSVNGYNTYAFNDFNFALGTDPNVRKALENNTPIYVNMTVIRDGEKVTLNNVEFDKAEQDGKNSLQLDFKVQGIQRTPITLLQQTFTNTVSMVRTVWGSLVGLVMGKFSFNDMSGPVGIATAMTKSASSGLQTGGISLALNNILYLMSLITVNLGIFNLLPLPALDGGRLVFLLFELISRRKVPEKYERWIHATGFILLLGLMLLVTLSDIIRLVTGSGLGAG